MLTTVSTLHPTVPTHQISQLAARPATAHRVWCSDSRLHCIRRVVINRNQWCRWLGEWCVQHHGGVHLTCSSMEFMVSWGFYEFDELSFDEMTKDRWPHFFFVTSSRKGINCNFCFCQWNASYYFKWTKVTLWTTSLYYVTLSIGDIEKHVQLYPLTILYPLAIRYVLKNMCNFSFCYEKIYCTYTVLLFLAHADHCLHSPPNSSNSSNIPTRSPPCDRSPSLMQW